MAAITSSKQNTLERMILPPFLFRQGMPLASHNLMAAFIPSL
ncbi:MAG: hypothetical protein PHH07_07440 [Candidatus Cloacimonetes bacterium]|nr:hypothetical protein [Candidatus Cloacimonadota bacterium]